MEYIEWIVHTTTEASEIIADLMWNYTEYGITVCDVNDAIALQRDTGVFWDYIDENLQKPSDVLVKCYFEKDKANGLIKELTRDILRAKENADGLIPFGTLETAKRDVVGDDWINGWKKYFRPIPLGKVVVLPEWLDYEKKDGETVVLLDSNMAFGTGEHETTRMCVEELQKHITPDTVCIDVGCGSGILGISAVKLGAKKAILTDIDPIAVESAKHNAKLNGVEEKVEVVLSDLLSSSVQADLLTANITGEILMRLAPTAFSQLKKGGTAVLSGIIESRLQGVVNAYREVGFTLEEEKNQGEWFALVLKKGE